ncbi:MAG: hypothetical protein M1354_03640 [Candidatus Marsarchaeota archaeon]|jgi:hypothetical protein|nr:hypothetical protein [Candidatus Marsarchaeota archaeon]
MRRAQTSIEFLLIASAVSVLCLGIILLYGKDLSVQQKAVNSIILSDLPVPAPAPGNVPAQPEASVYMPLNSTLGGQDALQMLFYGCSSGRARATLSSNSLLLSSSSVDTGFSGIYEENVYFTPLFEGIDSLSLSYNVSCSSKSLARNLTLHTYAIEALGGISNATLSAYITGRNESESYALDSQSPVYSLSQTDRCTQIGFFGGNLDIGVQCGTSDAWDYNVFSMYCFTEGGSQTRTYCTVPYPSGYNYTETNPGHAAYIYSFRLHIRSPYGSLTSNLSSSSKSSNVILDGRVVGTAAVTNVTSGYQPAAQAFVASGGRYYQANQSQYSQYVQARNNLYSVLGYYNQSDVSGDVQSTEQQAITAYQKAASVLVSSATQSAQGCSISGRNYTCASPYPFAYVINIRLNGYRVLGNQTLSYLNSVINLNES